MREYIDNYNFIFNEISENSKTGPIPVVYSPGDTCPTSCEFNKKEDGKFNCYGMFGNTSFVWNKLNLRLIGMSWDRMISKIKGIYKNQLWRLNVVGDLPGIGDAIDHSLLAEIVNANKMAKARGFTYTHKPVGLSGQELVNARAIYASNKSGFTINLSANDLNDADRKYDLGIAPVAVVVPSDAKKTIRTPKGRVVIICPNSINEKIKCVSCGICQLKDRKQIVGFPAHGPGKTRIDKQYDVELKSLIRKER